MTDTTDDFVQLDSQIVAALQTHTQQRSDILRALEPQLEESHAALDWEDREELISQRLKALRDRGLMGYSRGLGWSLTPAGEKLAIEVTSELLAAEPAAELEADLEAELEVDVELEGDIEEPAAAERPRPVTREIPVLTKTEPPADLQPRRGLLGLNIGPSR